MCVRLRNNGNSLVWPNGVGQFGRKIIFDYTNAPVVIMKMKWTQEICKQLELELRGNFNYVCVELQYNDVVRS